MMMQYQLSFGVPREFTFTRLQINYLTKAPTRYFDLIRIMATVFHCQVLRDESITYMGTLYIVGRKRNATALSGFMTSIIKAIEEEVEDHRFISKKNPNVHKATEISKFRVERISIFEKEIKEVYNLKFFEYYDKYAKIRRVHDGEIMDSAFFPEYIRENRLDNLKQFKWYRIDIS